MDEQEILRTARLFEIKSQIYSATKNINFKNWNLPALKGIDNWLRDKLVHALEEIFDIMLDDEVYCYFPVIYRTEENRQFGDGLRGTTQDDPGMIYIGLPFGPSEDEDIYFKLSLTNAVEQATDPNERRELLAMFKGLVAMLE